MNDLNANLTLEEAAAVLRITPLVLSKLANGSRPKIGSLKIGRTRVFPAAVIETYIEANTTPAAPPNPWGFTDASAKRLRRTA
jgi:hypothetical protein